MYTISLYLHSYTRWLVLISLVWALWQSWQGFISGRDWNQQDRRSGLALTMTTSIQFLFGLFVYGSPGGFALAAWRDFSAAMQVFELRFFALEHPLQMIIALTLAHLGSGRAKKADTNKSKFRWSVVCYTFSAILILSAIPWWRPLLRLGNPSTNQTRAIELQLDESVLLSGDPEAGAETFVNGVDGAAPCSACHAVTNETIVGPGLAAVGDQAENRAGYDSVEAYLHASIVRPSEFIAEGYNDVMPQNYGEALTEQQIADLIAYLKTLE